MAENQNLKYTRYRKTAWAIYYLLAVVIAVLLVLFVARDNEERFFYGLMTVAGAYVFRPTEKFFNKLIYKYTGVSAPADEE